MKINKVLIFGWVAFATAMPLAGAKVESPVHHPGSSVPSGPKIRVLLEKDVTSALLEVKGAYRVIRKDGGAILSNGAHGKRYVVHALQDGLRWGEEYPDVYQLAIVPLKEDTCVFVNGMQYKGMLSIYHVRDNHITIVNELPIEDFLKSTLAIKYENAPTKEAMAALAIAARTEAYSRMQGGKTNARPWDLTAQESEYFGFGVTQRKNSVEEAVDWTKFMVLEPSQKGGAVQTSELVASKAEELASQGFDAKKILKKTFPKAKLGITINPDEVAVR